MERIQEGDAGPLLDSAIICAAQKVEHYEIAAYGTLRAWVKRPGFDDLDEPLTAMLGEEEAADEKLTEIAGAILTETPSAKDEQEQGTTSRKGPTGKSDAANRSQRRAG